MAFQGLFTANEGWGFAARFLQSLCIVARGIHLGLWNTILELSSFALFYFCRRRRGEALSSPLDWRVPGRSFYAMPMKLLRFEPPQNVSPMWRMVPAQDVGTSSKLVFP